MSSFKRLPGTPEPSAYWKGFGGCQLAGDTWGDPNGPLVVLSHGVGQTRHSWKNTGQRLGGAGYYVVAYDARGHGDSSWCPHGDYGRTAMIRDLQMILQQLGRDDPLLVGASMGGATSLVALGEGYIQARALVLVDIAPHTEAKGIGKIDNFLNENLKGFDSLEEVADAIQRYRPQRRRSGNLAGLAKNVRLGEDGRYYWHWDPRLAGRVRDSGERRVAAAEKISLPTLLVRGERSDVVSEESVQKFLALHPGAEHIDVSGARHMITGDKNDVFGDALIDFLNRHSGLRA